MDQGDNGGETSKINGALIYRFEAKDLSILIIQSSYSVV